MTKDMKKILTYAISGAIIDVAGGAVALDIFNKATRNLQLKKSTFRSIGMIALKFGVFNAGMNFVSKEVEPTLKSIFGIDKMDPKKVVDEFFEDLRDKLNVDETVTETEESTEEEEEE